MVTSAVLYRVQVRHTRLTPFRYRLRHRSYQWLVDVDDLPRFRWPVSLLARFDSADHLGKAGRPIRDNVRAHAAKHGVDLAGGRILMLTNARVFGHVFNPLTVFWCYDRTGELACVMAEVHNTYGERHVYLLETDTSGRARTRKSFYVSPFFGTDGEYRMALPEPGSRLRLAITLWRSGEPALVATVTGQRQPATTWQLLAVAARYPLATLAVSAAIRRHGIGMYLRGLPVVPRASGVAGTSPQQRPVGCPYRKV